AAPSSRALSSGAPPPQAASSSASDSWRYLVCRIKSPSTPDDRLPIGRHAENSENGILKLTFATMADFKFRTLVEGMNHLNRGWAADDHEQCRENERNHRHRQK